MRRAKCARKSAPDFAAKLQTSAVGAALFVGCCVCVCVHAYTDLIYNFCASISSLEQFRVERALPMRCDATRRSGEAAELPARKAAWIRDSPMNKSHRGEMIFAYIVWHDTPQVSFAQLV